MSLLAPIFVLAFGTVIGSFLNAVVFRLHAGRSFVRGRSECVRCGHRLSAADLIPIFSFLRLGGRCRYCREGISLQYPLVEAATGLLFLLAFLATAPDGTLSGATLSLLLFRWFLIAVFVLAFVYDHRYMLILPEVVGPAALVALAANVALGNGWSSSVLGAAIAFGFFRAQFLISRGRWVGGGDAWLGLLIGAALGWQKALLALFLAYVMGSLVAVFLLLSRRKRFGQQLAFGTFLSVAAVIALLWGDALIGWYVGFLHL